MAKFEKPKMAEILDDDEDDLQFLSALEAAEAQALSLSSSTSKRRRVTINIKSETETSKNDVVEVVEGAYTAALKGSKSLTWQKQAQSQSQTLSLTHAPPGVVGGATRAAVGGGGGACFRCGMEGHWARDCGQSMSMSVSTGGEEGMEKGCPCGKGNCLVLTANTERNKGRKFFKCPIRQENGGCGFFEWCDESSGNRPPAHAEKAWKNGGQEQFHQRPANQGTSGFTNPWKDYDKGTSSMNSGYGAVQKFEAADNKGYGVKTGSSCFKCGEEGHWARDCPTSSSNATASVRGMPSSDTCYKCGGSGHWAKDCSQGQSTKLRNW